MNRMTATRWLTVAFALVGVFALALAFAFAWGGVSARKDPSAFEAWAARSARHLLIPAAARDKVNPLVADPELLAHARHHFAEHCAGCHGRDGRGEASFGRGFSPRV